MTSDSHGGVSTEFLLTAAAALAIQITKCCTPEEVELLAVFFNVLGDNLELLALRLSPKEESAR